MTLRAALMLSLVAALGCQGESPLQPPVAAPGDRLGSERKAAKATPPTPLDAAMVAAGDGPAGHLLEPKDGGFRVRFPATPEHRTSDVASPTGVKAELNQWVLSDERGTKLFIVAYSPLIQQLVDHGDHDTALDKLVKQQSSAPGRELLAEEKLELRGHKGRRIALKVVDSDFTGELHAKLFIVGYRMYQVMGAFTDAADKAEIDRFIASFQLTEDADRIEETGKDIWVRQHNGATLSVMLPTAPERNSSVVGTPFGQAEITTMSALSSFPPAFYNTNEVALPAEWRQRSAKEILDHWQKSLLDPADKPLPIELQEVSATSVLGQPARRIRARVTDKASNQTVTAHYLGFAAEGRFYELGFVPMDERAGDTEVERFLSDVTLGAAK